MTLKAAPRVNWNRSETLAALHVYFQLPFGQLHRGQLKIKQLADWIGRSANSVALKLVNFASLDPQVIASGRKGMRNASSLDKTIWLELQAHWDQVALESAVAYEALAVAHGVTPDEDLLEELNEFAEGKTRIASVEVRVNQARFRKSVLAGYNATCCISGLRHEKLVIASHILPWSHDTKNRLNPQNGLCLSALHDKAYDQGLITVLPNFTISVSKKLGAHSEDRFMVDTLLSFDGKAIRLPERLRPAPEFLAAHARRFGFIA
jgi:putative restriction endonuclease